MYPSRHRRRIIKQRTDRELSFLRSSNNSPIANDNLNESNENVPLNLGVSQYYHHAAIEHLPHDENLHFEIASVCSTDIIPILCRYRYYVIFEN